MISAQTICDSISPAGIRLFTPRLEYPKFIHGEFMTHRVLSRNASSSRAIPVAKYLAEVRSDELRATPIFWGKNQPGMQAVVEFSDEKRDHDFSIGFHGDTRVCSRVGCGLTTDTKAWWPCKTEKEEAKVRWKKSALRAADDAEEAHLAGEHKQTVNRKIEPYVHIRVNASGTEWMNFFGLRLDKAAQPEMRALAEAIWREWNESKPRLLKPGEWHLPYVNEDEFFSIPEQLDHLTHTDIAIRVSVARCCRVSYESFETRKRSTIEEDIKLHDFLVSQRPLHASPAEHQATPDVSEGREIIGWVDNDPKKPQISEMWKNKWEHGNFNGWRQYRKMLPGEACAPLPEGYK